MSRHDRVPPEDFNEALRLWAKRPPPTESAQAARQVVARLEAPGSRNVVRWALAAAAATMAVFLSASLLTPPSPLPVSSSQVGSIAVGDDELLLWLDAETPLYLTLGSKE